MRMVNGTHTSAFLHAGATSADVAMLRDFHHGSWFSVESDLPKHDNLVISTSIGARQGCAVGSMVFNAIYEIALHDVRQKLRDLGITKSIPFHADAPPWHVHDDNPATDDEAAIAEACDVEFVDDVVFMLSSASADGLFLDLGRAIDVIIGTFQTFGLEVNLKPGKTEIVMQLFGPHSRRLLRSLGAAGKRVFTSAGGNAVNVVEQYKHLGSISHESGSTIPDAKSKARKCHNAYGPLSMNIFGNDKIYSSTRLVLADSLCFTRLGHGCDTWVRRQPAAEATINHARLRVLRRIAGCPRAHRF